jgi:endonuclease/exonuclease/phosphatase family metal-dependent hydrolase
MLKVGTFNIQKCGKTKIKQYSNKLSILLSLYDVVFVQEIQKLVLDDDVRKMYDNATHMHVLSEISGRGTYKEKYCCIYKKSIRLVESMTFDDDTILGKDCFDRNPFIVTLFTGYVHITLVSIHTKPTDALNECNNLDDVAFWLSKHYNKPIHKLNIVILGDLNASGKYVRHDDKLDLITNNVFGEITNRKMDTMVNITSNNSYDRIFCTHHMLQNVVCCGVINMEHMFNMTNDQVRRISDHYPIEVTFYFKN